MIEGADVIAGAVVLLLGMGIGATGVEVLNRLLRRSGGQRALPKPPTCSCGDPPSLHDPETKRCHAEHLTKVSDTGMKRMLPCRCRQYDGPEPLPGFYAPEISP